MQATWAARSRCFERGNARSPDFTRAKDSRGHGRDDFLRYLRSFRLPAPPTLQSEVLVLVLVFVFGRAVIFRSQTSVEASRPCPLNQFIQLPFSRSPARLLRELPPRESGTTHRPSCHARARH